MGVKSRLYDAVKISIVIATVRILGWTDRRHRRSISWVVGMEEIAGMLRRLSDVIPGSHSVSLKRIAFYGYHYDTSAWSGGGARRRFLERMIARPVRFGWLLHRSTGFVYIARLDFLGLKAGRGREFELIRSSGKKLCCYFTGNDIRSPRLMGELQERTGGVNAATPLDEGGTHFSSKEYETSKISIARDADTWADVIFTAATDQLSYLTSPTEPFLYFHPDDDFASEAAKFDDLSTPVILHAASSPHLKGTAQVRAAIDSLRAAGYRFDYIELTGVPHEVVRENLARAHIVLNQFYAFMPGVFGIESLAARCAVLMSADRSLEPDLPPGAEKAWVTTSLEQIEENLKDLLDHPEKIEPLARVGQRWAKKYASASASGLRLNGILERVANGTYEGPQPWD